jgi:hypothetical protein
MSAKLTGRSAINGAKDVLRQSKKVSIYKELALSILQLTEL